MSYVYRDFVGQHLDNKSEFNRAFQLLFQTPATEYMNGLCNVAVLNPLCEHRAWQRSNKMLTLGRMQCR